MSFHQTGALSSILNPMAVARISGSTEWLTTVAEAMPIDQSRGKREVLRAINRPSRTAELTCSEVRALSKLFPADRRITEALGQLEASEARERARPRPQDLIAARRAR